MCSESGSKNIAIEWLTGLDFFITRMRWSRRCKGSEAAAIPGTWRHPVLPFVLSAGGDCAGPDCVGVPECGPPVSSLPNRSSAIGMESIPVDRRRSGTTLLRRASCSYRPSREGGRAFPAGAGKACSGRYSSKLDRNCASHSRCQDEPGRTAETQG